MINGSETPASNRKLFWGLIKDHAALLSLEWNYEKDQWWRRALAKAGGVILLACSFVFFQVALIGGLLRSGVPLWGAGLLLGFVYLALGVVVLKIVSRRMKDYGLRETRNELKRSFHWIEKNFL